MVMEEVLCVSTDCCVLSDGMNVRHWWMSQRLTPSPVSSVAAYRGDIFACSTRHSVPVLATDKTYLHFMLQDVGE